MKTQDEFAAEANRQIGRWYGHRMYFAAPRSVAPRFVDWIKTHWTRFPATDPTGGQIIDGTSIEIQGFLGEDP